MTSEKQTLENRRMDRVSDGDLLRQYVENRSETAFTELGHRYANLVYATCLRETNDKTLAEDASQSVFLLLSRKAGELLRADILAGWLYAASRNMAKNLMKQERRRRMYEAQAAANPASDEPGNALWDSIEPHFHDALDSLKPADREAVLLRFVSERSFAEVGSLLRLSENTARMRVSRAVEKLRSYLRRAGVIVSALLLASLLEERGAEAAPARLLQSLPQIAAGKGAVLAVPFRRTTGQALFDLVTAHPRLAALAGLVTLSGAWIAYQQTQPQPLEMAQQRQLFTRLAGVWKGKLEFADDLTRKRYSYPTTVTFRTLNSATALEYTSVYTGSSSIDTTTIQSSSNTGRVFITNGGPQSSHRLSGEGELVRLARDRFAFLGDSSATHGKVRLLILPKGSQLILQEEYRNPGQAGFQFRNRFTLTK